MCYNPTFSDEAMVLFNSICCGPQSEIASVGNSRHWGQGCKAKSCYLLVLLMAMPEAWWYLVLVNEGFPEKHASLCLSKTF